MIRGMLAWLIVFGMTAVPVSGEELFDTQSSEELFKSGLELYDKSDFEGAIQKFDQAIQVNPENIDAHYFIGYSYYKLDQMKRAMEVFDQAYEIDSKYSPLPRRPRMPPPEPGTLDLTSGMETPDLSEAMETSPPPSDMETDETASAMEEADPAAGLEASPSSGEREAPDSPSETETPAE